MDQTGTESNNFILVLNWLRLPILISLTARSNFICLSTKIAPNKMSIKMDISFTFIGNYANVIVPFLTSSLIAFYNCKCKRRRLIQIAFFVIVGLVILRLVGFLLPLLLLLLFQFLLDSLGLELLVLFYLRLEEPHHVPKRVVRHVAALKELLAHLRRSDLRWAEEILDLPERGVVLDAEVVGREELEPARGAVGHVDVDVHPPGSEQRRVELLLVVRREHDYPLVPAARPQPVYEIQQARECHLR